MTMSVRRGLVVAVVAVLAAFAGPSRAAMPDAAGKNAVLETYADIALAMYQDALADAEMLKIALDRLVAAPSERSLAAARAAWLRARVPYQQTEVYRFGNAVVDDWEGKVNAWPLDEGLIDYVDTAAYGTESDENLFYNANVIANPKLILSGRTIDATRITKALLAETLHEVDEIEANVATGYHAIEFLLWGQDLNGTGPGAGNRPYTDFDPVACTGGNCDRRAAYLIAAADLLIDDLMDIVAAWVQGGEARVALTADGPDRGLLAILTGLGSLSYGELAGERMQLGLLLHDPEEEHDCFADNTHNSHYFNQVGMTAIYQGRYVRTDGSVVSGPSPSDVVRAVDPEADTAMREAMVETTARMQVMVAAAEGGMAYDQMLAVGNAAGNTILQNVIDGLKAQTGAIEHVVARLDIGTIEIEGSDSLDNPSAVFQ